VRTALLEEQLGVLAWCRARDLAAGGSQLETGEVLAREVGREVAGREQKGSVVQLLVLLLCSGIAAPARRIGACSPEMIAVSPTTIADGSSAPVGVAGPFP
jgi:hypothetical protein